MKILLASIPLLAVLACAQEKDNFGPRGPVVSMAPPPLMTAIQGKSVMVPLSFRVAGGYHINSNKPKSEFLIPTVLKLDAATDIVIEGTTYPRGSDMSFAFAPDERLNVYTGDFGLEVRVRPLSSVEVGRYAVHGKLKYQACDNAACYPPRELPVTFDVRISKGRPGSGRNPAQSPHVHR